MTATYTPIASQTLSVAASSVTFSSLPTTFRDLVVTITATGSTTLQGRIRFNGDAGSNYNYVRMSGDGTTASGEQASTQSAGFISQIAQATTTGALQVTVEIMDYRNTNFQKVMLSRADQSANGTEAFATKWSNFSAITSLDILTSTGNFAVGSTFNLFGIAS